MPKKFAAALCAVIVLTSLPAYADDGRRDRDGSRWRQGQQYHDDDDDRHGRHHKHKSHGKHHKHAKKHHGKHGYGPGHGVVVWHGHRHWNPPPRHVVRHHRHHYAPHSRRDRDDWAIYAILALQLAEVLNSQQQQSYAWATRQAAAAPLGDSIQWHDSGAYGSVTALRDGTDRGGRYCREFQHQIVVGNRRQSGYGTACRQPDGAWEIVS